MKSNRFPSFGFSCDLRTGYLAGWIWPHLPVAESLPCGCGREFLNRFASRIRVRLSGLGKLTCVRTPCTFGSRATHLRIFFLRSKVGSLMPEISRFYGVVIQIYYGDHAPPHFHVNYAGHTAKVEIETLAMLEGSLPARARGWSSSGQAFIRTNSGRPFGWRQLWNNHRRSLLCPEVTL